MKTVLVVDTNSILDFNKFYMFDKFNENEVHSKLTRFLLSKIKSDEIIIIDKVYDEIYTNIYTEKLKKVIEPFVVNALFLFPQVQELIKNNQRKDILIGYSKEEIENLLRKYEDKHADLYLIAYCKYLKQEHIGINPILITEETFKKDEKLIEKIPTICKKEKIEFQNVPHALFEIYKNELKFKLEVKNK